MSAPSEPPESIADRERFLLDLATSPLEYDFHAVMRCLEALAPSLPRFGEALRPSEEPVRVGQPPDTAFASSAVVGYSRARESNRAELNVAFFGLLGPQGPLPLHLTEFVRERLRHYGDRTLVAFLNLFHHRMSLFFQRAWATAQPTADYDRPEQSRFDTYLAALAGKAPRLSGRLPANATLQYAGWFATPVRSPDGLAAILSDFFEVEFQVEEFIGDWLDIPEANRMRLGGLPEECALGRSTILGRRVYQADQKFRVRSGLLQLDEFARFLPGSRSFERLCALIEAYVGRELAWDLLLRLNPTTDTRVRLGSGNRLGFTTTLGNARGVTNLLIDPLSRKSRRIAP